MKHTLPGTLAAALMGLALSSSVALAQPYPPHPPGPPGPGYYHPPGGPGYHQWHHGEYYHGNRYVVNNWHHYRLQAPPPGYQWVQDGGQFVMIAVASGIIANVILNAAYQ